MNKQGVLNEEKFYIANSKYNFYTCKILLFTTARSLSDSTVFIFINN